MNATDQIKVLKKGFTIIRERDSAPGIPIPSIYAKTLDQFEWHIFKSGFPSKASRHRATIELLKNQLIIED